jgi:hypothetical protein
MTINIKINLLLINKMVNNKKEKLNPLLIVSITVLFVLSLTFLIIYYDWWKDYY